jgi:pseudouridine-5'-phosphate glycosidase
VGPSAAQDFDISADLAALTEYPVITVCAGAKAFMDIAATLEVLETLRVPVATYQSQEFPLFYTPGSGCPSPRVVQDAKEVAAVFQAQRALGMREGLLLAVPVPGAEALDPGLMDRAIQTALSEIRERRITGKEVTPFLLAAIARETRGRSLEANRALIRNNARVGAAVAAALAEMQ